MHFRRPACNGRANWPHLLSIALFALLTSFCLVGMASAGETHKGEAKLLAAATTTLPKSESSRWDGVGSREQQRFPITEPNENHQQTFAQERVSEVSFRPGFFEK